MPAPPRRPTREECCGRGCDPCILDYYERALERWEARVAALGHDPAELLAALKGGAPSGDGQ
ncbi:hypothetical protein PHZ_c0027 [Phenylobacterium zucineum HLK1]|uniref:Oxidoreductase-like domain-containing protein n=1 Tax=Phenylobacterium zucineum (strain HLK1) TaxID=450851 RepID=B4RBI1_PHEZH|nr:oxidoreductase-like domain-containing protein [Phenylobacterium zucineum]ACG76441.1 hypothetical protein PHZ_c0027 [Phenylobacterium zucineum HLK1]